MYTGLRFSDIFFLDDSKIISDGKDSYRLSMKEVKTGNKISNRLSQPALAILKRYGLPKKGVMFPMFTPSVPENSHQDNKQKDTWNAYVNNCLYRICRNLGLRRMGFGAGWANAWRGEPCSRRRMKRMFFISSIRRVGVLSPKHLQKVNGVNPYRVMCR